ncbi:DEAD/DEAH box helicase [Arthrobacter sp. HLT1-20]
MKRVNGHRLSPQTLKYVRFEGDTEVEVSLDEVRRLGETDAKFRRSIVSSDETLTTIVDASLQKLSEMREETGEKRLKIIASALNMAHCKQIVAKYRERNYRADFVHSKQDSNANQKVHAKLENDELDVIVQVRKLGEGFDHPYLSVAAVFSIFSNLGPFMQFVGRIMRVIPGVDPFDKVNDGVVVFHVGGNITGVWDDFTDFADADQEYFANLVDVDFVEPILTGEGARPRQVDETPLPTITSQTGVRLENIELLGNDRVMQAIKVLTELGVTTEQFEELQRLTPTKQASRQAKRSQLDDLVKTAVGQVLAFRKLAYPGHDLDKAKRGRTNFEVLKGAIDKKIKGAAPSGVTKRAELSGQDLDSLIAGLSGLVKQVEAEFFDD